LYIAARVLSSIGSDAMDRSVEEPLSVTTKFSLRVLGRMANFQAAVGLQQLYRLPERNAKLAENGRRLAEKLSDIPSIQPPPVKAGEEHVYLYFRVLVPQAKRFRALLLKRGIDTQPDDMQNCAGLDAFKEFAADCPVAASLPDRSIELPNTPRLSEADTDYIAKSVREVAAIISSAGAGGPG
ncbi:MAG: DegT/DnrJ/EryC1/StrS family aminotransferase, partial [Planctomycetes bacterium]|nr:DegT/DnrJ/EryC1/StrS family aminotransferase [Planctomycetota bacterium]